MRSFPLCIAMLMIGVSPALAQDAGKIVVADSLAWADAPPAFPKGAKIAVVSGDPAKEGPVVVRLQLPANYKVAAHQHPTTESVTVLAGSFHIGMGEKFDPNKSQELGVGDFVEAPAGMIHYVWTTQPALIQVHGQGPLAIKYVDPADEPRNK